MKVLSIIAEDHPGLLAEVTALLERAEIEILDFNGQTVGGTAVLTIQANPREKAFQLLSNAGFRVVSSNHLLVRLDNRAGELARLSRRLADAQIDVRGMHIISRNDASCIVALETEHSARARELLADLLVAEPEQK